MGTPAHRVVRRPPLFCAVAAFVLLSVVATAGGPGGAPAAGAAGRPSLFGGEQLDPSTFSPGACVAYPPTSATDQHETVFLDAGHGGIDPGAVGTTESGQTVDEADETLPVELDAMALLRAAGFRVVVSRTTDTSVVRLGSADVSGGVLTVQGADDDVAARDVCANLAKADVLVGIYFDAGGSPSDAGSLTAYDAVRPFAADNLKVATLVQNDVLAELNENGWAVPNDGVVDDSTLGGPPLSAAAATYGHLLLLGPADPGYFSAPSEMPGALIEPLFITDPFEATIAASPTGQGAIALGIAQAVEQYLRPAKAARLARR